MTDAPSPLLAAVERHRRALLAGERQAAVRLVRAYGLAYTKLQGDLRALMDAISSLGVPTWAQVERLSLYRSLMGSIRDEIGRFAALAEGELSDAARAAIARALADSEQLIGLALPRLDAGELRGVLTVLVPEQVETLVAFLAEDSPLYANLAALGDDVARAVADELRTGIVLGFNPRKVAAYLVQLRETTGLGLTWALRTARTTQLWAYREATRANYLANSHVVRSWIWHADLGPRTCLSCVNMHGSEHPLDEPLNDHHNGRCTMLPKTVTYRELGLNLPDERPLRVPRGETWFRGLPADEQRARMGEARYRAWRDGRFRFTDLTTTYANDVYGRMRREANLRELVGVEGAFLSRRRP